MRADESTERARQVALHPDKHDRDALINALAALRVAHDVAAQRLTELEPDHLAATKLRAEVADRDRGVRVAIQLQRIAEGRVVDMLVALDGADPELAKQYRAAWGIW